MEIFELGLALDHSCALSVGNILQHDQNLRANTISHDCNLQPPTTLISGPPRVYAEIYHRAST